MASRMDSRPPVQDMPPKTGYPEVNVLRRHAKKVPGSLMWGTLAAMFVYGMYKVHQGNMNMQEMRRERRELRVALAPYLQAEEDIRFLNSRREARALETEIMREVPHWDVNKSVYHNTNVWVKPPINDLS
eukprot:g830.t1